MSTRRLVFSLVVALLIGGVSTVALAAAQPAPRAALRPPGDTVYVVQYGDTLYGIALRFGVTVQAIAAANGITNPNLIYVGQQLTIPGVSASATPGGPTSTPTPGPGFYYTVQAGDTLFGIGLRYGVPYLAVAQANGISYPYYIYVGQRLWIPSAGATPTPMPTSVPGATATSPAPGTGVYHTVQAGETLFGIGVRYNVSYLTIAQANNIAYPYFIYAGQRLWIPGAHTPAPTPTGSAVPTTTAPPPTATPAPGGGFYHTVAAGETLYSIGLHYGISYLTIAQANNIAYPYYIYAGQQLWIPGAGGATPTPGSTAAPPAAGGFGYGIQVHLLTQDYSQVLNAVQDLGLGWVKLQIEWSVFEPTRGNIDWGTLDGIVNTAKGRNLHLLFSVVHAPDWARSTTVDNGPPANFADYSAFVGALAQRYRGRVNAYEIWNEQNLSREWRGDTLSAARYVPLLQGAYQAIKAQDAAAVVVAGALAPTGINDGVNAIDDRVYLRGMYQNGVASVSDAIGAHPSGWANAPEQVCCRPDPSVPSFNDHPSFFFRQTLEDYRAIMVQYGDGATRIWATEFGWGSNEMLGVNPPAGYEYVAYNTQAEQGDFLRRAFVLGRSYGWVGPMFVWNLNFCPVTGAAGEQCLFGLVMPDWSARPAYATIKTMSKP